MRSAQGLGGPIAARAGLAGRLPADQATVRRLNLGLLMRSLVSGGPRSRARLAEDTGLNKATVSSLVSELAERGMVTEGSVDRSGVGRPSRAVQVDRSRLRSIGLELNVDYVAGVITDLTGTVLARHRQAIGVVDLGPARGLGRVAEVARALVAAAGCAPEQVETLTLSVPGMIDIEDGILYYAPNLRWRQVDLVHTLMGRLGWPRARIRVDNDANLGAMAEYAVGRSAGSRNLLYLVGEIGVGAGLMVDGRLQRGATGFAGEVGHMPIGHPETQCGCGRRGCWEMSVGLRALASLLPDIAELAHPDAQVFGGFDVRLAEIVRRADEGDPAVLSSLKDMGNWLGVGASVLANVLDPEVIVLGGHFTALSAYLASRRGTGVRRRCDGQSAAYPAGVLRAGVRGARPGCRARRHRPVDLRPVAGPARPPGGAAGARLICATLGCLYDHRSCRRRPCRGYRFLDTVHQGAPGPGVRRRRGRPGVRAPPGRHRGGSGRLVGGAAAGRFRPSGPSGRHRGGRAATRHGGADHRG